MATPSHIVLPAPEFNRVRKAYANIDMIGASLVKMMMDPPSPETASSVINSCILLLASAHGEIREVFGIEMSLNDSLEFACTGMTTAERIQSEIDGLPPLPADDSTK